MDVWFRVMRKRRNVYLWLVDAGAETKANFMLMAKKAGVASSRVIFGDRADFGQHIQVFSRAFARSSATQRPPGCPLAGSFCDTLFGSAHSWLTCSLIHSRAWRALH